jgi:SAM-dependent methyltransferase
MVAGRDDARASFGSVCLDEMKMKVIIRKFKRVITVYQEMGLAAVGSRLLRRIRLYFGSDDPNHARWLREKLAKDAAFDEAMGTRTGGVQSIFDLTIIGENARYGLSHIASDPAEFAAMMASLDIDYSTHTFIDLGSGKGRALLLASEFPFRRIIGIEFAVELHKAAKENLSKVAVARSRCSNVELICGDAAEYTFPPEPLVIYLFNPFGSAVVRRVAENALFSWQGFPRPMQILYVNPIHLSEFVDVGWLAIDNNQSYARLLPKASAEREKR